MNTLFLELTTVLILAGLVSFLVSLLKQPSIVGYIIAGLLIGPLGFYRLQDGDAFSALAQVGITLLLFMVGLQLDISQLKRIGRSALAAGIGQVVVTTALGYLLLRAMHFSVLAAGYI
ncbi:MAG TPA: cation:proton antiporter, partial [Patescibacteria group bacterium]|nr:cation:proton antiporter [Patescibacteria group bacterium]